MTSVARQRLPFGLSIGSILASFIIIGGVQVMIAGLRAPASSGVVDLINWIGKVSHTAEPLRASAPIQWNPVIENLVLSAIFVATGLGIGAWLRRDPR
jgi:hypothetical protein